MNSDLEGRDHDGGNVGQNGFDGNKLLSVLEEADGVDHLNGGGAVDIGNKDLAGIHHDHVKGSEILEGSKDLNRIHGSEGDEYGESNIASGQQEKIDKSLMEAAVSLELVEVGISKDETYWTNSDQIEITKGLYSKKMHLCQISEEQDEQKDVKLQHKTEDVDDEVDNRGMGEKNRAPAKMICSVTTKLNVKDDETTKFQQCFLEKSVCQMDNSSPPEYCRTPNLQIRQIDIKFSTDNQSFDLDEEECHTPKGAQYAIPLPTVCPSPPRRSRRDLYIYKSDLEFDRTVTFFPVPSDLTSVFIPIKRART